MFDAREFEEVVETTRKITSWKASEGSVSITLEKLKSSWKGILWGDYERMIVCTVYASTAYEAFKKIKSFVKEFNNINKIDAENIKTEGERVSLDELNKEAICAQQRSAKKSRSEKYETERATEKNFAIFDEVVGAK